MKSTLKYLLTAALLIVCSVMTLVAAPQGGGMGGQGGGMGGQGGGQGGRPEGGMGQREAKEEVMEPIFHNDVDGVAQRDSIAIIYADAVYEVADPNKLYRITGVNVYGVELMDPTLLITSVGINIGDSISIPSSYISNIMERLWAQRRYSDIQVGATIMGNDLTLDFLFKEQPRVSTWAIEGLSKTQTSDLKDKLRFRRNSELSDYVIDKNIQTIKNYYAESGFRNTEVDVRIENDSIHDNMVNVTFIVDRKSRVRIGEITFEGNEVFTDKKLRSAFKTTHQKSINIFQSRRLKEKEYADDKGYLIDFYNSKGYRNATILSDSIYVIDDKTIGIALKVAEGNKYYIRNIDWVGNTMYSTEDLQRMFGVVEGDAYDKKTMYKRLGIGTESSPYDQSVVSIYQNEGYLMSQIDLSEVIVGADSIDLEVKVFEGKPFTINDVNISGNVRVDDEVIRREIFTRPGELYNRALLMQTMQTLGTMGHFNAEAIMPDINPVSSSMVDIGWSLEEQASDQFNISGGWGGSFVGSVGVTLNNLSVRDMFNGEGRWRPYPMGQNQKLSLQASSSGSYYNSVSLSFVDPWLGGKKPNSFSASVYYSSQSSTSSYYYSDSYYTYDTGERFRTFGVSAGLGKRLSWPDPYFSLYTQFAYTRYTMVDWSSFIMDNGYSNVLSLTTALSRSSVDQTIYPRRGSNFNLSLQLTPPYSLFDGRDYSDEDMSDQERYRFIEFHKWNGKVEWYQSFTKKSNLVLMLKAEMGFLGSYNPDRVSPFERFEVGGDGLSGYSVYGVDIVSLRGYESGALDPSSTDYSLGYNKVTMELRYPIIMEASTQIYMLAFFEAGSGYESWRTYSPLNMKRSAGLGVRFYLPIIGLMGIDWGYGFDIAPNTTTRSGGQFHFVLGQQF